MATGNGTKVWTSGQVKSTRFANRVVATYVNNNPAGTFQTGSIGEFNQEYFPPEPNSDDCPYIPPAPYTLNIYGSVSNEPENYVVFATLTDEDDNAVSAHSLLTFDYIVHRRQVSDDTLSDVSGSASMVDGAASVALNTFPIATYYYEGDTDISNVTPAVLDGHTINVVVHDVI